MAQLHDVDGNDMNPLTISGTDGFLDKSIVSSDLQNPNASSPM
jgi:hypothetical protein